LKFSVIVPVFNTAQYVDRCVDALLNQNYPHSDYEVIAVDNGSSDDSLQRLARYPVKVVQESRRGSYAARNAGIREAGGELLAFTDSDCAPRPEWLSAIEAGLSGSGTLVVQGKRRLAAQSKLMQAVNDYEIAKDAYTLSGGNPLKYYGFTNNMGMHREAYDRFGPFVERDRGADTIFVRTVVDGASCEAVAFCPDMVIDHLEMNRFRDYLEKMYIYGRSRKRYRHIMKTEALDFSDRYSIYRSVIRDSAYSPWLKTSMSAALGLSIASWQMGSWYGSAETALGVKR
jgi:glycosyltransferase involved in cell wall biosynthesis